jgi:hypothetical protein
MSAGVRLRRQPSVDTPSNEQVSGVGAVERSQSGSILRVDTFADLEPAKETDGALETLVQLMLAAAVGAATAGLMLFAHRFLLSR